MERTNIKLLNRELVKKGLVRETDMENVLAVKEKLGSEDLKEQLSEAIRKVLTDFLEGTEEAQSLDREEFTELGVQIWNTNFKKYLQHLKQNLGARELIPLLEDSADRKEKEKQIEEIYKEKISEYLKDLIDEFSEVNLGELVREGKCSIEIVSLEKTYSENEINGNFVININGVDSYTSFQFKLNQEPFYIEIGGKSPKVMRKMINTMLKNNFPEYIK